ncbi:MAG TPA: methyltransferase domain-containing protein [Pyrinomonadaceae bacterium]|nr:methyltransferase domain-containing protein [Pyrinomonadaceae bacterium]
MLIQSAGGSAEQVRADFDRIALVSALDREELGPYSEFLLGHVPAGCARVLEVGCGLGAFARLVAQRACSVTAVDLSPQMLRAAGERSRSHPNLQFILGDFLRLDLPPETYDCVVTTTTLHHLPLAQALGKMKSLIRPGGVLIVHDLLEPDGLFDTALNFVRLPVSCAMRFRRTGRFRQRREVRQAWDEHGRHETYLKAEDVRAMRDEHLPGALVRLHLLWRYTVVWHKPDVGS